MNHITEADLYSWNDPDELLQALGQLGKDQKNELREAVAALLEHDDADIREEAMRTLFVSWKDQQWRDRALAAVTSDEVPEVRSTAAYAVAATSTNVTRQDDTRLLLGVLEDEHAELPVRAAAYDALLILNRKSDFPTKKRKFNPQEDIDWHWVRSLNQN